MHTSNYIKIATAIKSNTRYDLKELKMEDLIYREDFIKDLIEIFKTDNLNFDEQKFREACK